jgi:lipopolysaccharide/colanic/teichoic acid biosynthesis glycosyltransferase
MTTLHVTDIIRRRLDRTSVSPSRILDLVIATAGLILLSPVMVVIALAICVESGRPIFFSQIRLGLGGQHFWIYKFRKFHKESGPTGCPLTTRDDPRMSRIGWLLARTKLDELPQLWNVFKGDMAIVGPRPESLDFADCFTELHRKVLDYKPGIFGPSQVAFRDECSLYPMNADPALFYREVLFPLKAHNDLSYYPARTVASDIGWIVRGVLAVVGWSAQLPEMAVYASAGGAHENRSAQAARQLRA